MDNSPATLVGSLHHLVHGNGLALRSEGLDTIVDENVVVKHKGKILVINNWENGSLLVRNQAKNFYEVKGTCFYEVKGTCFYEVKGTCFYEVKGTCFYEVKGTCFYEVKVFGRPEAHLSDAPGVKLTKSGRMMFLSFNSVVATNQPFVSHIINDKKETTKQ